MLSRDLSNLAKVFEQIGLHGGRVVNPVAIAVRLRAMEAQAKELESSAVPERLRGVVDPHDPKVVEFQPAKKREA